MSTRDGIVCTAAEYAQSSLTLATPENTAPAIYCLTRGQSIGLAFSTEAGMLSVTAVLTLFVLISRNIWRSRARYLDLIREPVDLYVLCLFIFDLLQGVGGLVNARWVTEGKVYTGPFCTFQGTVQQIGETGVALSTLVIALHTFRVMWWIRSEGAQTRDALISYWVTGLIFMFVILFVGISVGIQTHPNSKYYEMPTPYWCWISGAYGKERIAGEYFWMWLTVFTSIILYVPLYFLHRRNITVDPTTWWKFKVHRRRMESDSTDSITPPFVMLAYPAVYWITVLPNTVARWVQFYRENHHSPIATPSAATFFAEFLYRSSGFVNIVLYLSTRRQLLAVGMLGRSSKAPSELSLRSQDTKDAQDGASPDVVVSVIDAGRGVEKPARIHAKRIWHKSSTGLAVLEEEGWDLPNINTGSAMEWSASEMTARNRV